MTDVSFVWSRIHNDQGKRASSICTSLHSNHVIDASCIKYSKQQIAFDAIEVLNFNFRSTRKSRQWRMSRLTHSDSILPCASAYCWLSFTYRCKAQNAPRLVKVVKPFAVTAKARKVCFVAIVVEVPRPTTEEWGDWLMMEWETDWGSIYNWFIKDTNKTYCSQRVNKIHMYLLLRLH